MLYDRFQVSVLIFDFWLGFRIAVVCSWSEVHKFDTKGPRKDTCQWEDVPKLLIMEAAHHLPIIAPRIASAITRGSHGIALKGPWLVWRSRLCAPNHFFGNAYYLAIPSPKFPGIPKRVVSFGKVWFCLPLFTILMSGAASSSGSQGRSAEMFASRPATEPSPPALETTGAPFGPKIRQRN